MRSVFTFSILVALLTLTVGCPSSSETNDGTEAPAPSGGNDHGHSHDAPGPAGGHLLEIGDEEYHVEWVHDEDDEGLVEFIVRDEMAKEEVPITAKKLVLEFTVEDAAGKTSTREVDVPAVGRTDENPKTARFELTDRVAIGNLLGGDGVTTVLKITIDGVNYEKEIDHTGGHGHSHGH